MTWYRLGDGYLGIDSEDDPIQERVAALFGECAVSEPAVPGPRVVCLVRCPREPSVAVIDFLDPEPLDTFTFAAALFPERGFHEIPSPFPGWRLLGSDSDPGSTPLAVREPPTRLLAHRTDFWRSLVGNLAVNRLLRLQRDLVFFHAGSVTVAGCGALLIGPKGSGKTTVSLGLAARGHGFFGDELAGVRLGTLELVPIRRSASVRAGPATVGAAWALDRVESALEPFPDGAIRRRVEVGRLFPGVPPEPAPLRVIFFLSGWRSGAEALGIRFTPGRADLGMLTPLGSTLWGMSPAPRAMQLLRMLSAVRCFRLEAGTPDATADLVERTLEEC